MSDKRLWVYYGLLPVLVAVSVWLATGYWSDDKDTVETSNESVVTQEFESEQQPSVQPSLELQSGIGSLIEYSRNEENTVLEKRVYSEVKNGQRVLEYRILYRRDKLGNLRSAQIFDGQQVKIFRIAYGYEKGTKRLVAENMYDVRGKRTDTEEPAKEQLSRALRYSYDAQGNRSEPMNFISPQGVISQQRQDWLKRNKLDRGTMPEEDPFLSVTVNQTSVNR